MQVSSYESTKASHRDAWIKDFSLMAGFKQRDENVLPFHEWVERSHLIIDGSPFTYKRHEYLKARYEDDHPFTVDQKAAQMGLTIRAMLGAIYGCRFKGYRGVLYLFPSRTDVTDFSKGRVDPLIADNPDNIGKWVQDTDAANIKRIHNGFLYLRGMKSKVGLKSVPADEIDFDELDEAPQNMMDMAMARMDHSEYGVVRMLSNPTLPDFGINKVFQQTDKRYWLLKCEGCGDWNNLIEEFPQCLLKVNGKVIRACKKCQKELNPANGKWVAESSSVIDKRGYQFSQLFSQYPSAEPAKLLNLFETTNNMRDFYNLKLGLPYEGTGDRLSIEQILELCGDEGILSKDEGPSFMGVDQGKDLHVLIGKRHPHKAGKIIYLGIHKEFEELYDLMDKFNITRCVIDDEPNIHSARKFAHKFNTRVFLHKYNDYQKGFYKWDEEKLRVSTNRTESLDASAEQIQTEDIILPSRQLEIVQVFAKQMHNVMRKLEIETTEDGKETGNKKYIYVRLGEDHFRHSFNYECIARSYASHLRHPEFL